MPRAWWCLLVALAGAGCDRDCPQEIVHVKITGACGATEADIEQENDCRITLVPGGDLPDVPRHGEAGQDRHPLRKGDWQLYGDVCQPDAGACPGSPFRRCAAKRVDTHIELTCIDGTGAPVCEAQITE